MAKRVSLLTPSSRNQANELLRLCLTPASEFRYITSHLHHPQRHIPPKISTPVKPQNHDRTKPSEIDKLLFFLNKSYQKIKTLPDTQLKAFVPSLALQSHLEISASPITQLHERDEFEVNEKTIELNTKLSELLLQLKSELPLLFEEPHPFAIYSKYLQFDFQYYPFSFKLRSRLQYKVFLSSIRSLFKLYYSDLRLDILKITKSQPDYSICTRWSLSGVSRLSRSSRSVFDGVSTFYMDESGQVYRHTLERVSKDRRKVPPLAWFFIAVGYPSELKDANSSSLEFAQRDRRLNKKNPKQTQVYRFGGLFRD